MIKALDDAAVIEYVVPYIHAHQHVNELNLKGNQITSVGIEAIIKAVRMNQYALKKVELEGNPGFKSSLYRRLSDACDYKPSSGEVALHCEEVLLFGKSWGSETWTDPKKVAKLLKKPASAEKKAKKANKMRWNPLHVALYFHASSEVIEKIFKAWSAVAAMHTKENRQPLHIALEKRHPSPVIEMLLDAHPDAVRVADGRQRYPLHLALTFEHNSDVVERILEATPGSCVATLAADDSGNFPLHIVLYKARRVYQRSSLVMKVFNADLQNHASPPAASKANNDGNYPLHIALDQKYDASVIEILLTAHPDAAKQKNNSGMFPLHIALQNEYEAKVIQMIVDAYPGVRSNMQKEFPLHIALDKKYSAQIIELLLEAEPESVKFHDENSRFPVHVAVKNGYSYEVVKSILKGCPDVAKEKDDDRKTPVDYALVYLPGEYPAAIIELLLAECPTLANRVYREGMYLLALALKRKYPADVVEVVLKANPSAAEKGKPGKFPLDIALEMDHPDALILQVLNANPSAASEGSPGTYPLDIALGKGREAALIKQLLDAYPDAASKGSPGTYPLDVALNKGREAALIKQLLDAYPDAASEGSPGTYPLDVALNKGREPALIQQLLDAYPDVARKVHLDGKFLLTLALERQYSAEVVEILFNANPEAAEESIDVTLSEETEPEWDVSVVGSNAVVDGSLLSRESPETNYGDAVAYTAEKLPVINGAAIFKLIIEKQPKESKWSGGLKIGFVESKPSPNFSESPGVIADFLDRDFVMNLNEGDELEFSLEAGKVSVKLNCESTYVPSAKCPHVLSSVYGMVDLYGKTEAIRLGKTTLPVRSTFPLHIALEYEHEASTVEMLLKQYPTAAEVANKDGAFPLDFALEKRHSTAVTQQVLNAHSVLARVPHKDGQFLGPLSVERNYDTAVSEMLWAATDMDDSHTETITPIDQRLGGRILKGLWKEAEDDGHDGIPSSKKFALYYETTQSYFQYCIMAAQTQTEALKVMYSSTRDLHKGMYLATMDGIRRDVNYTPYNDVLDGLKRRVESRANPPGSKPVQRTTKLRDVYEDAVKVEPRFSRFMDELVSKTGSNFSKAPRKSTYRALQKIGLAYGDEQWDGSRVKDMVRGAQIMADFGKGKMLLELLVSCDPDEEKQSRARGWNARASGLSEAGKIQIVGVKNRFRKPSSGGWSDANLTFVFNDDPHKHICEVQLAHADLMRVRTSMGAHKGYDTFRCALELLEATGHADEIASLDRLIDESTGNFGSFQEAAGTTSGFGFGAAADDGHQVMPSPSIQEHNIKDQYAALSLEIEEVIDQEHKVASSPPVQRSNAGNRNTSTRPRRRSALINEAIKNKQDDEPSDAMNSRLAAFEASIDDKLAKKAADIQALKSEKDSQIAEIKAEKDAEIAELKGMVTALRTAVAALKADQNRNQNRSNSLLLEPIEGFDERPEIARIPVANPANNSQRMTADVGSSLLTDQRSNKEVFEGFGNGSTTDHSVVTTEVDNEVNSFEAQLEALMADNASGVTDPVSAYEGFGVISAVDEANVVQIENEFPQYGQEL